MSPATLEPPPPATSPRSRPARDVSAGQRPLPKTIGPRHNGLRMSGLEWDAHRDWVEGYTYELIDGVLIVCPAPGAGEREPNDELAFLIRDFIRHNPAGPAKKTLPEQYITVGPNRRRRCDRAIWLDAVPEDPDATVPDIAIEIVSDSARDRQRDYVDKRAEYATAGVKEYWVLDRHSRTATVYAADGSERTVAEDGVVTTPLMPGFELPMSTFLEAADRYAKP